MLLEQLTIISLSLETYIKYQTGEGWLFTPIKEGTTPHLAIHLNTFQHIDILAIAALLLLGFGLIVAIPALIDGQIPSSQKRISLFLKLLSVTVGLALALGVLDANWKFTHVQLVTVGITATFILTSVWMAKNR